jgi:predicted permease
VQLIQAVNIGGQISVEALPRYLPIVIFSLIYNAISITTGLGLVKLLNLPTWTTPACTFNNTISFPLLLIQSLESTGVLDNLLWNDTDTVSAAVTRAKSYFLLNAMIADSLTFGLGPRLLESPHHEDAPDKQEDKLPDNASAETIARHNEQLDEEAAETTEETSLLPNKVVGPSVKFSRRLSRHAEYLWEKLPAWLQNMLSAVWSFVSPPLVGACIGLFIGLIPQLKTAFFADTEQGGIFNAWLTKSVENIGNLFTSLQVVVVGVKLSQGESRGKCTGRRKHGH